MTEPAPGAVARLVGLLFCGGRLETPARAVDPVLRWLHDETAAARAAWHPADTSAQPSSWPPEDADDIDDDIDDHELQPSHGDLAVDVDDGGGRRYGRLCLWFGVAAGDREAGTRLDEAGALLALALRDVESVRREASWTARLVEARTELAAAGPALAAVRATERRRLAAAVLARTDRPVENLVRAVDALRAAAPGRPAGVRVATEAVRVSATALLEQVRRLARGTYSNVLRESGPVVALAEIADDLDHAVVLSGDTSVRAGWEIESGLFWAVTAVLHQVDRWPVTDARRVRWSREPGRLTVGIEVDGGRVGEQAHSALRAQLVAGLAHDARRLEALAGDLEVRGDARTTTISLGLPDALGRVRTGRAE